MNAAAQFLWGMFGSVSVDILNFVYSYNEYGKKHKLPLHYKDPIFYLTRFVLAFVAGGLAVAFNWTKPILCVAIGVSTPNILKLLGQGLLAQLKTTLSNLGSIEDMPEEKMDNNMKDKTPK